MATYIILGIVAFVGCIIQVTMGFGGAVLLVNVMPFFFPYNKTVAIVQACMVTLNVYYSVKCRKSIRWKVILPAMVPGVLLGIAFTFVSISANLSVMTVAMGVLFILLAVYYIVVIDKINIKPNKITGFVMGSFSGLTNAFFGLAGPPIALYLASSIDDKLEYFASCQMFFLSSSLACVIVRLFSHVYGASDIPVFLLLTLCCFLGSFVGMKVLKKVKAELLRKLIYAFIGMNGIYLIVKSL